LVLNKIFTKEHINLISIQPVYDNKEDRDELQQQLEFSLSTIDEQRTPWISEEMSIIYIPALARNIKQHMSSFKVYQDHHFIDISTFTEEQDVFLNQLEMSFHNFHDPVDFYIELYFSKDSYDTVVGIISDHSCKYPLLTNLFLQASYHLKIISNHCMQGVIFISSILTWLHWKYDFN
jgi:hypothetical protein